MHPLIHQQKSTFLIPSYSSYFGGKKGISRNKTSFFLLMYNSGGAESMCRKGNGEIWAGT